MEELMSEILVRNNLFEMLLCRECGQPASFGICSSDKFLVGFVWKNLGEGRGCGGNIYWFGIKCVLELLFLMIRPDLIYTDR
jgi:hypothetical protein